MQKLINFPIMRNIFYSLCLVGSNLFFSFQLIAQEQPYLDFKNPYLGESVLRPLLRETQFGYGMKNIRNDFFNSLVGAFNGLDINFIYPRFSKKGKMHIQSLLLEAYTSNFPVPIQYLSGKSKYSILYVPKFLKSLQEDFNKLYLGFNVGANVSTMLASRNINNQVFPVFDINGGLSLLDIMKFKLKRKFLYLQAFVDLNLLGLSLFRPLYLNFAPGYLVENAGKNIGYSAVSALLPNNYQSLNTELKLAYPVVLGKKHNLPRVWYLLFSYIFELMNSKVNNIQFSLQGHGFHIGIVRKLYE